ncbi:MAG: hypothetical protein IPK83_13430 [Planctomycetes bacterium]|nr:hypothetical protein [Planctomycetota bacterium]
MFGLPFLGGGGGIFGLLPVYAIFFVINLILQLFTGNLNDLFVPPDDLN